MIDIFDNLMGLSAYSYHKIKQAVIDYDGNVFLFSTHNGYRLKVWFRGDFVYSAPFSESNSEFTVKNFIKLLNNFDDIKKTGEEHGIPVVLDKTIDDRSVLCVTCIQ